MPLPLPVPATECAHSGRPRLTLARGQLVAVCIRCGHPVPPPPGLLIQLGAK